MRILQTLFTLFVISGALLAQQPSAPKTYVSSADVSAMVAKAKSERKPDQANFVQPLLQLAPIAANLEYRVATPQSAAVHEKEAEVFYVVDGSATLVTGGRLKDERRTNAENLTGTGVDGGSTRRIAKGDFVLVPENTPHWFTDISGALTLMSLHVPHTTSAAGLSGQGGRGGAPPPMPLEPGASQANVDKALMAAPPALRDQATVIKWKPDFTYDTLRKGTNGLVCYDRSGFPLQQPFSVQCTSLANLPREVQNLKAEASGERSKSEAMLKTMEQDGTRVKPEFGSMWYHVSGPDQDHVSPHQVTIAVPGATQASLGLPEKRRDDGAWVMNAGTSTAHIMIPGK